MSLIHRVGAGLIVVGGLLPVQAQAQWPMGTGCGQCGTAAPMMAPMAPLGGMLMGPAMGPSTYGPRMYGPRMYGPRMQRPYVYRSRTRTFMSGPAPFGDATMGLPMGSCGCGSASPIYPQQAPLIVPQTTMCPQQVTTYVNVPKTVMRQEAVQVQVPTTTYKQVTVDEGGYQQVWVPRVVTKSVPQTVMQTQVQYRQVPQTVFERVPQISTQWLPQQPVVANLYTPSVATAYPIATATTVTPVPEYNPSAVSNPVPVPTDDTAAAPKSVPPQTSQIQEWQKVRQRQPTIQQQKYEYEASADQPSEPKAEGYLVPKAAGRFSSKR